MTKLPYWIGAAILLCGVAVIASGAGDEGPMPDFGGAAAWLNSPPLSNRALRGKVVLVNFWTYSCINSLRELPYLKAWAAKYKDAGLVVIGVHAPEFDFEKDQANVKNAVSDLKVAYPIPIDSSHSIWSAFQNEYWPADYFVDAKGRIRYHHFGEGEYAESERVIQTLLRENGAVSLDESTVCITADGAEAPPGDDVRSPETYVGYARAENFASPERMARGSRKTYSPPSRPALNQWGLGGPWNAGAESSRLESEPDTIVFRFHSRDLHMVLGPSKNGAPVRFRIRLDGAVPANDHGSDSGPDGSGEVRQPRMYQLVRQKGPVKDVTFEIEFLDPGRPGLFVHVWLGHSWGDFSLSTAADDVVELVRKYGVVSSEKRGRYEHQPGPLQGRVRRPIVARVDMKLEAVVIPVADVDRAKDFYAKLGWRLDADFPFGNGFRVIQFTPPGSGCSVPFGTNITSAAPGSAQGIYLIVSGIVAARDELVARGVDVSEVFHAGAPGAQFQPDGTSGRVGRPALDHGSYGSYAAFRDPDGNGWLLQEVTTRLPGRLDLAGSAFASANDLASALKRAQAAHGQHEKRSDVNWPDWYAEYIVAEQAGKAPPR